MEEDEAVETATKVNRREHIKLTREQMIVRASMVGILTNILLAGFKAGIGLLSNSIAVILDAVNNLSDSLSSIITIVGMKLAGKPADQEHPFGHGRIEYLGSVLIAGMILAAGITSLAESGKKILHPTLASYSAIMLVIIAAAVITKLCLGRYVKKAGEKAKSDSLIASGADALFDAAISASTLIGAAVSMIWKISIDGFLGAMIALIIIKAGFEMLSDTLNNIIGQRVDSELSRCIKAEVNQFDEVHGTYDLILHNYGPEKTIGSAHIAVREDMTAKEIHKLVKDIQLDIHEKYGIFLTIGIYAINSGNEKITDIQAKIMQVLKAYPHIVQMHAFYLDQERSYMSFDIMVDFAVKDVTALQCEIVSRLAEEIPGYKVEIAVDRFFSD